MIKSKKFFITVVLIFSFLLCGCTQSSGVITTDQTEPTPTSLPQTTPTLVEEEIQNSPDPTELPDPTIEAEETGEMNIAYRIEAALNYDQKLVEVKQAIRIGNLPVGVQEILLVVEPNRYENGFQLYSLEFGPDGPVEYSLEGNRLMFRLPPSADASNVQEFDLVYSVRLPQIPPPSEMYKPQPYGYTDRQLNLVDWYAFLPPLDENNQWIIHNPPVFGESLVYPTASVELELTVSGSNLPLVVAASSPAHHVENTYTFSMSSVRTFGVSVSPYYTEVQSEAEGISIKSYAFGGYEAQNQMVLQNALEAVALFSDLFGVLPRESVSIVQADFLDGMEFDGLYFVSRGFYDLFDGSVKGYLTLITVHEMAHQWWFSVVGNDQAVDPWLDESLATFAEQLYFERYYPDLVDWWRYYRVEYYEPQGVIDLPIYEYPSYAAYRNAVYLRGALFFDAFRDQIGKDRFDAGLKQYYETNKFKIGSDDRFFSSFKFGSIEELELIKGDFFQKTNQ